MRFRVVLLLFAVVSLLFSCSGAKLPATPLETFKTYMKALKKKDTTTMKVLLSAESIKMHQQEAKSQGVTLDEIVMRETLFSDTQKSVDFRNETIDGIKATIEVKNTFGEWEKVPFVLEDGEWKIDKKGYADRFMQDIEQKNRELDQLIDQGKQSSGESNSSPAGKPGPSGTGNP